jgi:hypothetical protein
MEDRGWRMEDGGWRMEDGGWRMEDGGWRMKNGGCEEEGRRKKEGGGKRRHINFPDFRPRDTPYDSLIAIFGNSHVETIQSLSVGVLGIGEVGSEISKCLAMVGVGSREKKTTWESEIPRFAMKGFVPEEYLHLKKKQNPSGIFLLDHKRVNTFSSREVNIFSEKHVGGYQAEVMASLVCGRSSLKREKGERRKEKGERRQENGEERRELGDRIRRNSRRSLFWGELKIILFRYGI